jgi:iron complex outermembrane receptor protein
MQNDPRQSRPATPVLPSAAEQKAGVRNQTVMAGLSNRHRFNPSWSNTTSATFSYTYFRNPFITNYETRAEWNGGLRSKFLYEGFIGRFRVTWISGLEWQEGRYRIDSAGNNKGEKDTSGMVTDQVKAFQGFLFSQADLALTSRLGLQAGISLNDFGYHFERTQGNPQTGVTKAPFEAELVPRLALYVKITPSLALHASASKGFSPPTLAEIRPSAGGLSLDLQAEQGWSYEAGGKGSLWRKRLQFDATLFRFTLDNAIVRRVNAAGAEYFTNAGGTRQQGLETYVEGYPIISWSAPLVQSLRIWTSATFSDFTFENYSSGSTDYSGNELTGVPRQVVLFGWDLTFLRHLNWNTTFNYTSRLPLNDANSVYASDYRLWQSRLGWKKSLRRFRLEIFAGVDNAADELYSLGNDINAFGGRYYNPAPVRNYYGGALIHW